MQVSIGRTLHYRLTEQDVEQIKRRRTTSTEIANRIAKGNVRTCIGGGNLTVDIESWPLGAQAHIGNPHHAGQSLPLVVCVVWPNEYGPEYHGVNGQVLLDGNDALWVTSIKEGTENGTWSWPQKEESAPKTAEAV